jgi:hypothetical protein
MRGHVPGSWRHLAIGTAPNLTRPFVIQLNIARRIYGDFARIFCVDALAAVVDGGRTLSSISPVAERDSATV